MPKNKTKAQPERRKKEERQCDPNVCLFPVWARALLEEQSESMRGMMRMRGGFTAEHTMAAVIYGHCWANSAGCREKALPPTIHTHSFKERTRCTFSHTHTHTRPHTKPNQKDTWASLQEMPKQLNINDGAEALVRSVAGSDLKKTKQKKLIHYIYTYRMPFGWGFFFCFVFLQKPIYIHVQNLDKWMKKLGNHTHSWFGSPREKNRPCCLMVYTLSSVSQWH